MITRCIRISTEFFEEHSTFSSIGGVGSLLLDGMELQVMLSAAS